MRLLSVPQLFGDKGVEKTCNVSAIQAERQTHVFDGHEAEAIVLHLVRAKDKGTGLQNCLAHEHVRPRIVGNSRQRQASYLPLSKDIEIIPGKYEHRVLRFTRVGNTGYDTAVDHLGQGEQVERCGPAALTPCLPPNPIHRTKAWIQKIVFARQ